MRILDRYVAAVVIAHFLLALAALLAVFSVINLTQELGDVGAGGYAVRHAFSYVLLTLPTEGYELFPAAALIGTVNGLGMLASHNEIVALGAGGISNGRLVRAVLQAGACLVVCAVALGELVAAPTSQRARAARSIAISGGLLLSTPQGVWLRDGLEFVNIRTPLADGRLRDLYFYDFDDRHRLRRFGYARTATRDEAGWRLAEVVERRLTEGGVTTQRMPVRVWTTRLDPSHLRLLLFPPEALSLGDLRSSVVSLRERGEDARPHELAFWRRVTMPLVTGVMALLAVPFVITTLRGASLGGRIVAGTLVGIGFQMFSHTFGRFGLVYGLAPFVSAVFPGALALALAVLWFTRASW
jgi:lipopolysaccharide export system permease protein